MHINKYSTYALDVFVRECAFHLGLHPASAGGRSEPIRRGLIAVSRREATNLDAISGKRRAPIVVP